MSKLTGDLIIAERLDEEDVCSMPELERLGWRGPGWYYWDADYLHCHGPFQDEWHCELAYLSANSATTRVMP